MSTSRPKLTLDEQSFQDMLAAAFTIQEHNAKRRRSQEPQHVCTQCGAPAREGERLCELCSAEEQRPGEQLQRKWASMWLMSQEQGVFDQPAASNHSTGETVRAEASDELPDLFEISPEPKEATGNMGEFRLGRGRTHAVEEGEDEIAQSTKELEYAPSHSALAKLNSAPERVDVSADDMELVSTEIESGNVVATPWNLRDLRLRLRFHRADLYLVAAIIVSTFAMIWVLSAAPVGAVQKKPRLRPWERAMVSLGLADAPESMPGRGNPNIPVWVDPKTALYYCVGEELYGKAPGGRPTTQREAQMDQYEPASRAACE
jgi:hypothetical protein